jgi:hypothetical protein
MKNLRLKVFLSMLLSILWISGISSIALAQTSHPTGGHTSQIRHVLLISVDGLHALDLARYVSTHPTSTLAALSKTGTTYTHAFTTRPSDSFPGLLSMTTGGTPRSTGVYYDDSYDRTLSPPGSKCSTVGTEVLYDESIDANSNAIDGGGSINTSALPLDPKKGCTPVYPHSYLRVNTIFEVIKAAGLRTAWSDKHLAYDLVNGPSGKGVDDLYTPEIAAVANTTSATEGYDALKVQAILNEIDGKDHTGANHVGVPAIFGMNFQAVSVAQKLPTGGYTDAQGTPSSELQGALDFVDQSLHKMVQELQHQNLNSSTTIIVTAKHGQTPIDRSKRQIIDSKTIPALVNSVQSDLLAQATQDDVALLWLKDQSKTNDVVQKLKANEAQAGVQTILSGVAIKELFGDPLKDPRVPDIVVLPNLGVIYSSPTATKIAEHGGFSFDDTNIALLVANPQWHPKSITIPVTTTQIAPTILHLLDINPEKLQAVRLEHTGLLPGF